MTTSAFSMRSETSVTSARTACRLTGHWVDDAFHPAEGVHPGLAISLRGGGLLAPAIRDAGCRSLEDLSSAVTDLVNRARGGRLRGSEMTDPTITVSGSTPS